MKGFRILLVDDLESLIIILEKGLRKQGHTVFSAGTGGEAIEIFKRETIDMVVCDMAMDGLDGCEVSRTLRDICRSRGVPKPPFILMTGWGGVIDQFEPLYSLGVDRVVEKPVTLPDLEVVMRDVCNSRH